MDTTVVDHPIVASRLTVMRDERSSNAEFRSALTELSTLLVYEATRTLAVREIAVTTPVTETTGTTLANPPLLVPVLRAGLGMAEAAFNLLPESLSGRPVIVLDPMLATGGSLIHCVQLLVSRGADDITVVCALSTPEGLANLAATGLPIRVFTASIDDGLNENAFIVPGLGDAGDRQFGPR